MSRASVVIILSGLLLPAVASRLQAQKSELAPLAYQASTCQRFIEEPPPKSFSSADPLTQRLRDCLDSTADRARTILTWLHGTHAPTELLPLTIRGRDTAFARTRLGAVLITDHRALKLMHRWVKRLETPKTGRSDAAVATIASYSLAGDILHDGLQVLGLDQLFSAAIVTGGVVASGDQMDGSGAKDANKGAAHLVWESKHFGDESNGVFDGSIRGKIGFTPALTLVQPDSIARLGTTNGAESAYQEALVWDIAGRVNFQIQTRTSSELTLTGRIGQTIIGTQSTLLERGATSVLAVPIGNNTGSAEYFFEGGLEYSLYNNPIDVVHAEGSAVTPLFTVGFAVRKDNRFKSDGKLETFDKPSRRGVFRFMLDGLQVLDKRDLAEKGRTFTVSFGVEHEFAFGEGKRVPVGTKLMIKGDLDLLKALRGR